ncbi:Protein grpE [Syntrophobotulus glycolicus DSM 8271]|uniref:Protein GrpE n=1 Tax=Syntrophobotulus glycolicus (strain DSM 8271 / FlGlyR) TaxID=645991 RepID=F0SVF0_SYNGF|nr:nucleotide exchange factor GrpE [Syntrophobotulus glycolicus]ADY56723.1 Protein grpE [Syntrophobotulus glycolicus DSM 8271]
MSEEKRKDPESLNNEDAAERPESDFPEEFRVELEEYKSKSEEYYEMLQRMKAEFDNFRKRTQKEKEENAKYASEEVIVSLLPVLDNLERAIESSKVNRDFDTFSHGVDMILRQFVKVMEGHGLAAIEALGRDFDPNLHEALIQEESEHDENIILEELQKGYLLKEKVIRPSMVKVSK